MKTNWEIGKLLIDAQGGKTRAKYGDGLIKEWGIRLSEKYGKKYGKSNLAYMHMFYLTFLNFHSVSGNLTWTHIRSILPIKNEEENKKKL